MFKNNKQERSVKTERHCYYCVNHKAVVDFKDIPVLRRFVSTYLKIAPRRRSGLCALHQRQVARAVKQARVAGLMGYLPR